MIMSFSWSRCKLLTLFKCVRKGWSQSISQTNFLIFLVIQSQIFPLMSHYIRSFFCVSEMCMTSNIVCGTSKSYREHHIQEWIKNDLPFTLCVRSYISLYVQLQLENRISHFQEFFSIFYCNYIFVRSCNQNSHFPPPPSYFTLFRKIF